MSYIVSTDCSQHVTCDTCEYYKLEFVLLGDGRVFEFSSQSDKFGKLIAIVTLSALVRTWGNMPAPLRPTFEKFIHSLRLYGLPNNDSSPPPNRLFTSN